MVVTGVQVGKGQAIVQVAKNGTTSFGTATVTLTREGGKDVYKVSDVVLKKEQ